MTTFEPTHGTSTSVLRLCGVAALVLSLSIGQSAHAQELKGRSRIEFQLGITMPGGTTIASVGNLISETESVGALGAIALSHWVREQLAVTFSVGGWVVDLETRVGSGEILSRTALVVPFMGGVRYYFPRSSVGTGFRPYGSFTAGPVFGRESESSLGAMLVHQSITRTALGARAGAGFDMPFAGSLLFGMFGGYYLMSDFSDPIGSQKNHSSPDVGISLSWTWGGES